MTVVATGAQGAPAGASGEYAKHFEALRKLSIEVAEAMPAKEYGFRPHPESMDFGGADFAHRYDELSVLRGAEDDKRRCCQRPRRKRRW